MTTTTIARPRWLNVRRVPSEIDTAFDACSFACGRCPTRAYGPPTQTVEAAADHVLAAHADDRDAAAWARDQLAAVVAPTWSTRRVAAAGSSDASRPPRGDASPVDGRRIGGT